MAKIILVSFTFLLSSLALPAFEKLPAQYQVSYGNTSAPIKVVEYFSLSCPKCLQSFKKDFKSIRESFIDTNKVHWSFHVNPTDLATLQAMVCLEKLPPKEKRVFWEVVIDSLDTPSEACTIMQVAMEALGKPLPQLSDLSYLEHTNSFKTAYKYLKQADVIQEIPTVEINGKIHDAFPSLKFLEKQFSSLSTQRKPS